MNLSNKAPNPDSKLKTAVILAAGRGTRLEKMTDFIPKCLIEVGGNSLLERMLTQLEAIEIQTVVIVVGYQADKIIQKIGHTYGDLKIIYVQNEQWETTNNVLSLYLATDYLKTPFLLLESDLIFESSALESFTSNNSMAVEQFKNFMDGTVVSLSDLNNVIQIYLKSSVDRPTDLGKLYKTVNIYSFVGSDFKNFIVPILKELLDEGRLDVYYELAFERALQRGLIKFKAIDFKDYKWAEIDDQKDWIRAQNIFSTKEILQ
jgi:choline kinase